MDEARRDAVALVLAALRGDEEGVEVIVAGADLVPLLRELSFLLGEAFAARAAAAGYPPELAAEALDASLTALLQA